jgi:hypothetical protein
LRGHLSGEFSALRVIRTRQPFVQANVRRSLGLSGLMAAFAKKLIPAPGRPPAEPRRLAAGRALGADGVKRSGVPTGSHLAENAQIQTKLTFHHEMQEVMRHDRVVSGRRIHLDWWEPLSVDRDRITAGAGSTELDFHN